MLKRVFYSILLAGFISAQGCNFPELRKAATEPDPATGRSPIQTLATSGPAIVAQPTNLVEWANVVEAVTIMAAAGFGATEWRRYRRKRDGS